MNYREIHESLLSLTCMCVLHVNDIVQILPVSKKAGITYAHSISSLLFSCSILIFRSGMDNDTDIVIWKGKIQYKTNILIVLSQALGLEVTYHILAHLVLSLPIKTRPSVSFLIKGTVSICKLAWLPKIQQDACGLWDRSAKTTHA